MAIALTKLQSELYELATEFPQLKPTASNPRRFTSFCSIHGKDKTSDVVWSLSSDDHVAIACRVCGDLTLDQIRNPKPQPVIEVKQSALTVELPIESITVDTRAQSRAEIDMGLVAEYAELMRDGVVFPPLTVLHDGSTYWLSEGFHRIHAYREAAFLTVPCIVKSGGLREAILLSVGSNADHGKRRSNADKRRSVELLLKDTLWTSWSDREIAKQCAVSHEFVRQARSICQPLTDADSTEMVRTATKNGTTYTVNVGNIGAKAKTDADIEASRIRKEADAFISGKELKDKEETESTNPDYDDSAYVKKAQDDASLDSFYKFSEIAASFCNEKNANFLKNLLIKHSEYYRDRWRRSVKDSISNVMTFLDNKYFYMKALDEVLFEIVPHYEKRETTTDSEELIKLRKEVIKLQSELFNEKLKTSSFRNDEQLQVELEKAQRSCKFWKTKIKDKEQRTAYEKQEQYWREPKEVKFGDPEFLERFEKMREEQINIAAKTYGLQRPMPLEVWRRLIQLTHPDKHNGSAASIEASQWLLENKPPKPQESNDKERSE